MNAERFETLAGAYGGDLRRWPAAERAAAEVFRTTEPDRAAVILTAADDLDFALDAWRAPAPSAALREAVLAAAPRGRRAAPFRSGLGLWLSGAGLAAVAVAGVIVGVVASSAAVSDARADAVLSAALSNEGEAAANPFTVGVSAATT
jgi:hypothetical protein